jgi:putative transposase
MERKYEYRRKMPHYQPDYKAFFVTFSTYQRWTLPESVRDLVVESCRYAHGKRVQLHGLVVMPDHVHMIFTPLRDENGTFSLAEIIQGMKGASAHRINKSLGRKGTVWEQEFFDRALRQDEDIDVKLDYILANPVRAGLVQNPLDYPWLWREAVHDLTV